MTDFLETRGGELGHVRLRHVGALIELLRHATITERDHVRRRYTEQALHFDATVEFASQLGFVRDDGHSLSLSPGIAKCHLAGEGLSQEVWRRLWAPRSPLRAELRQYIRGYFVVENRIIYKPTAQDASRESGLRNLLMDLQAISHDPATGSYILDCKFSRFFAEAVREVGAVTPDALSVRRNGSEDVGLRAEELVLSYERERVGENYAAQVIHIAKVDATAGYDIESITIGSNCLTVPRLIETKAVPADTLRFYWSANEVATARRFGSWYHLYLVPVAAAGHFEIDRLVIVPNPYQVVMLENGDWCVEHDGLRCERKERSSECFGD